MKILKAIQVLREFDKKGKYVFIKHDALGDTNNQIFVSRYKLELPSEEDMKIFLEQSLKEQAVFS